MSTFNGEPYPGFFRRENETEEQYQLRQPKQVSYGPIKAEVDPQTGQVLQWDGSNADWVGVVSGSVHDDEINYLKNEITMLKDRLERTEAFTNSILQTLGNRVAASPPPMIVHEDDFKLMDISLVERPTDNSALLPDESDYDRAMSLVGK